MTTETASKPNCYDCKWRRTIHGDAHTRCGHPSVAERKPLEELRDFLATSQHVPLPLGATADALGVTGHPQGIRGGWFHWPSNFDPIWLVTCNGYERTAVPA